jgi:hypothetical protein
MATFMGRPITKETISLGLGGQIERGEEMFPPRSQIKFEAVALMSSVKHKFATDGTVEESYILVIDPATFRVREISGPEPGAPELPL